MPAVCSHGIDIHYEVTGSGGPVILLHSFLCSGEMWREQVEPLAEKWQVINVDARGHGSSGPVLEPFSIYDMVDDATAVLDAAGVQRAVWAGLSIGGMVGLRAALREPDRVAGLALLDTDAGTEPFWRRIEYRALGTVTATLGTRFVARQIVRRMFGPTTRRQQPDLVSEWSQRFVDAHVPSMLNTLRALLERDDLAPHLSSIELPALVLVGDEDAALPPDRARALAAALPQATYREVPGAGHLSALERPDTVTSTLQAYLDEVYSSASPF